MSDLTSNPAALYADEQGRLQRFLMRQGRGQRRVTAVFDAAKADSALDTIAESPSLRIYRAAGLLTVIVSNDGADTIPAGG